MQIRRRYYRMGSRYHADTEAQNKSRDIVDGEVILSLFPEYDWVCNSARENHRRFRKYGEPRHGIAQHKYGNASCVDIMPERPWRDKVMQADIVARAYGLLAPQCARPSPPYSHCFVLLRRRGSSSEKHDPSFSFFGAPRGSWAFNRLNFHAYVQKIVFSHVTFQ